MGRLPSSGPSGPARSGDHQLTGFGKAVAVVMAVLLTLCAGMFLIRSLGEPIEVPHMDEDRLGLITAGDLAPYFSGLEVDEREEKIIRKEGLFGNWELKYEYSVVGPGGGIGVVQSSQVIRRSRFSAEQIYRDIEVGLGVGLRLGVGANVHKEERNDILTWGDESNYSLISTDDSSIGSIMRVWKGNRVILLTTVGIYIDDYIVADQIYGPILERAFAYDPKTGTVPGLAGQAGSSQAGTAP